MTSASATNEWLHQPKSKNEKWKFTPKENHFSTLLLLGYSFFLSGSFLSKCVDYLIKPISIKELQIAVEKAKNNIIKKSEFILLKKFDNKPHKITIPTIERNIVINVDDIIYCQADRSWTTIYLVSARKHIKFEIDSFCYLLTFLQVIDTKASNHCKKIKI